MWRVSVPAPLRENARLTGPKPGPRRCAPWGRPRPRPPPSGGPRRDRGRGPIPGGGPPRISVRGNRFVDPSGNPVLFRGVSIADPDNLVGRGQWRREFLAAAKEAGADLVRIPVHPAAWRRRTTRGYLALLDQAVDWCTDLGMHVIIDWRSIGNLERPLPGTVYTTTVPEKIGLADGRHAFQGEPYGRLLRALQ